MSLWVAYLIIFVYWLFVALFIGISAGKLTSYFDPTPVSNPLDVHLACH